MFGFLPFPPCLPLDLICCIKFTQPPYYVRFSMPSSDVDIISGSSLSGGEDESAICDGFRDSRRPRVLNSFDEIYTSAVRLLEAAGMSGGGLSLVTRRLSWVNV